MSENPSGCSAARPPNTPAKECSEAETHLTETVIPPNQNRAPRGLKTASTTTGLVRRLNVFWEAMRNSIDHAYLYENSPEEE